MRKQKKLWKIKNSNDLLLICAEKLPEDGIF